MILKGKLSYNHIQNCLSGAIIISGWWDMFVTPFLPILIGWFGGAVTLIWYNFLPKIFEKAKYYDTRGVFFLHGVPSILGGIISAIACATL